VYRDGLRDLEPDIALRRKYNFFEEKMSGTGFLVLIALVFNASNLSIVFSIV
jgi:hypothetical protein